MRFLVKLHQPVHIQALAVLRLDISENLISRQFARQLNLEFLPVPINQSALNSVSPPPGSIRFIKAEEHTLTLLVADCNGKERSYDIPFIASDIDDDIILGMKWLEMADITMNPSSKTFHWKTDEPHHQLPKVRLEDSSDDSDIPMITRSSKKIS